MSNLRWWQRPLTFCYGDGTIKKCYLEPIRNLTMDLRADPKAYDKILEKMALARAWLATKQTEVPVHENCAHLPDHGAGQSD